MKGRPVTFVITSLLEVSPDVLWERVASPAGIGDELAPLLRMTLPAGLERLTPETVPLGERLCRSWILLFGVLPVEWDDLTIVELEPGRRFLEQSSTATLERWEHERIVEAEAGGSRITDRLTALPRLPLPSRWVRGVVAALFRHRHARLQRRWGGRGAEEPAKG